MMRIRNKAVLSALLLFGAAACTDLQVTNENQPETERVLATPGDVEALIAGSFVSWYDLTHFNGGIDNALSVMSFQHSAMAANFGMEERGRIPRIPIANTSSDSNAGNYALTWTRAYRAIKGANDGLRRINGGLVIGNDLQTLRAKAFAKFVQGLGHATLAQFHDSAFIYDETVELDSDGLPVGLTLKSYNEVMTAALAMMDTAIAIAQANNIPNLPAGWLGASGNTLTRDQFARLVRSFKARFRAEVARNPQERANVDWNAVIADVDNGIQADFRLAMDNGTWNSNVRVNTMRMGAWNQVNYFVLGMADVSGAYQQWMATPVSQRMPFLLVTPDLRFPQGATVAAQQAAPGRYIRYSGTGGHVRSDRGTWRWSFYEDNRFVPFTQAGNVGSLSIMSMHEMRLLKAEGLIRTNRAAEAVPLINVSREGSGGLPPVTEAGVPSLPGCVPRLPNGDCGDLMEALKWEKRLETWMERFGAWYFDGRGWGDLIEGTPVHFPIPAGELETLRLPLYTYGGVGGQASTPVGTYGY